MVQSPLAKSLATSCVRFHYNFAVLLWRISDEYLESVCV